MTKLFLSYRRLETDACGRIYDRLTQAIPKENIFRDIDSIPLGVNFSLHIQSAVAACDVLLVLIGPQWTEQRPRLDDPRDFVRIEVEAALARNIPVIPVLLGGTAMPTSDDLPEPLKELAFCNGARVRPDPDFHGDVERLIQSLKNLAENKLERNPKTKAVTAVFPESLAVQPSITIPDLNSLPEDGDTDDFLGALGLRIVDEPSPRPMRRNAKLRSGETVGIDLGTTFSAVAQLTAEGNPVSLPNADGRNITPSVVLFSEDGSIVIGPSFERSSQESPERIVEAVKRQMGNKNFYVVFQNNKLTAEFVSALILKKMKQDAEKTIGPIANAVITVPYYFNDVRRRATQDAGRIAGLNVIDIINEPTAAALAYAWMKGELGRTDLRQDPKTILMYDLGGGTFDVTVVRYTPTQFRVLAADGDVMLGGIDWTRRIVDHVADQFQRQFGIDPRTSADAVRTFTLECEDAKRALSTMTKVPLTVYHAGKTLTLGLTRNDFERMTYDLLQRTQDTTELVLQQAKVDPQALSEVVLVGGSTYMPAVETMLEQVCQRKPSRELRPEEAVAQGAAIHAAIIESQNSQNGRRMAMAIQNRLRRTSFQDVCSHSLGIRVKDDDGTTNVNQILIPKNTALPHEELVRVATNSPNQRSVRIRVLQGDYRDPDACLLLDEFVISDLPVGLPAGSPIDVTYKYDESGRVHVTALVVATGQSGELSITCDGIHSESELVAWKTLVASYLVE